MLFSFRAPGPRGSLPSLVLGLEAAGIHDNNAYDWILSVEGSAEPRPT
jgi:hypothetical protein